jgi:TPP-dependent trihydroxycyclohexane-1,2-dione (THcHDO) dehydratase
LSYKNLSTPASQAHIHVGATKTSGAFALFLCGPAGSAAHMACPNDSTNSGTVTDTLSAADVVINAQGIKPGELAKVLAAIAAGNTYVNVHSSQLPGGEIRGQVSVGD